MAFVFARKHKRRKTYYVGYYVDGRSGRRSIGRSKALGADSLRTSLYGWLDDSQKQVGRLREAGEPEGHPARLLSRADQGMPR